MLLKALPFGCVRTTRETDIRCTARRRRVRLIQPAAEQAGRRHRPRPSGLRRRGGWPEPFDLDPHQAARWVSIALHRIPATVKLRRLR